MNPKPDTALPGVPRLQAVHVVSHTHWDREWYHTAARFRMRLIALVDAVLASRKGPFLLDGQAIVLRDYLEWRPERAEHAKAALASGHLEAGPWFVLADNLIVSGEAIVRNLEAGRRVLARLGASAPPVAYCPDSFGHPAAIPMIAAGFGLDVGVVWRGLGGASHPRGDSLRWRAPDGSELLTCHLPPDGYEFGSALSSDPDAATRRWQRLKALFDERARTPVVLLPNGADHHAMQPDVKEAVAVLAAAAAEDGVHVGASSLSAWASQFAQQANRTELPVVDGELRDSYGYTWTLSGTLATRAHQKRRNARLERGLLRDVEPWIALGRLHDRGAHGAVAEGADAQLTRAHLPILLQRTWETLLGTHPHDTLCGCSIDEVARRMESAQDDVASMGQELRTRALQLVVGHNPVHARRSMHFDWRRVVVRNRAPRTRGGLARVRLVHVLADAPVGPGSASPPLPISATSAPDLETGSWMSQVMSRSVQYVRRESPQHYPDNDLALVQDTLIWIPAVAASGVVLHTAQSVGRSTSAPEITVTTSHDLDSLVASNGRVQLISRQRSDGTWEIAWRCDDRNVTNVLSLATQTDLGDTYTPSLRGAPELLRCRNAHWVASGPLRATMRLTWSTPASDIRVFTDLSVTADSLVLLCDVHGNVARTNQKLQLVWHTGIEEGVVWADAAFGGIQRVRPEAPEESREAVPAGMPMHRWATSANPLAGVTLFSDGLAEADVTNDRISLTLVRSVGELSRADLPERPGHAGWPEHTPDAQCQGNFHAKVGMLWHGPMSDDTRARIRDACDDVLLPLVGESWRDVLVDWSAAPRHWAGPLLSGEAFEQSAFTASQVDADAVILRAVNLTDREAHGAWHLPDAGPWMVTPCRLDETPTGETWTSTGHIPLHASPRGTITVRVCRADRPTPLPTS